MANGNGRLSDSDRISLAATKCPLLDDGYRNFFGERIFNKYALIVYRQCVLPTRKAETLLKTRAKPKKQRNVGIYYQELEARERRIVERERIATGREQELQHYDLRTREKNQQVTQLDQEIEQKQQQLATLDKLIKERDIEFTSAITFEHLKRLEPEQLSNALIAVLQTQIQLNQEATKFLDLVRQGIEKVIKAYRTLKNRNHLQAHQL